jgi:hypothetical protein
VIDDDDDDYVELNVRSKTAYRLESITTAGMDIRRVDQLGWKKGNSHVIKELL